MSEVLRLDQWLMHRNLVRSRPHAEALIKDGGVTVNGKVVLRPGKKYTPEDTIVLIKEPMHWVSRGAYKLLGAMNAWKIDVEDHACLDVGASTGGFTHVLLDKGAKSVFAVDTGTDQLAPELRADPRVSDVQQRNIRDVQLEDFDSPFETVVIDVSFVGLSQILPEVFRLTSTPVQVIALVKPQFEVGKEFVGKNGIVRKEAHRQNALKKVIRIAKELGFVLRGSIDSPIQGGDGNYEYLIYLTR
ncbi:MAG: 23S rRNA (cytidine1920-2'-O)/16S rRNA (cytidine1409-2'-O)-methyltransferase [Flavobacteriales bacterium]|jgi:23S rRNA (cytidine1920-2'-O)/16S rRNA (cytidine1409-2'-O)-methyltransferase